MSYHFADQSWPQPEQAIAQNTLIILPIAQTAEHGRHLPVSTDAVIAREIASSVAERLHGELPVLVMPVVWANYKMKAMTLWPGCMTIRPKVVMDYVIDGSGQARVFIDGYNGSFAGVQVSDSLQVIGLASEDGEGQRIRVRKQEDVGITPAPRLYLPLIFKNTMWR